MTAALSIPIAKRALCIGINDDPGTQNDLRGCVNDANDWAAALVAGFEQLITSAKSGDTIAITFSGHGTLAPDTSGDEVDGDDEALCPYDIHQGHGLIDDEIHELFRKRPAGVRLILISDSCHSGTVTRNAPPDPEASDAPRIRFLPLANLPVRQVFSPWAGVVTAAGDLLMAGCEEGPDHCSYDATFSKQANGAFTHYALRTLKTLPPTATYRDWHAAIRRSLPSTNYPQKPQLLGTKATLSSSILA